MPDNVIFRGFTPQAPAFLAELAMNNNKTWFEEHRAQYKELVYRPMELLVMALTPTLLEIDHGIVMTPRKCISRIHRDTRFSKDKSPYRSNCWLTLRRPVLEWQDNPCFYFEITPVDYRYGMGFYAAERETMDKLRALMDHDVEAFRKAISFYNNGTFALEGDAYKRLIKPDVPEDLLPWYQKKNFYLACNRKLDDRLWSVGILEDLKSGFQELADFYHYLLDLKQCDLRQLLLRNES